MGNFEWIHIDKNDNKINILEKSNDEIENEIKELVEYFKLKLDLIFLDIKNKTDTK